MSSTPEVEILDVEGGLFERLPPCIEPRFDHRSCDYWEDEIRGSKDSRPSWWQERTPAPRPRPRPTSDNPFAPPPREEDFNPFASPDGGDRDDDDDSADDDFNPFAPMRDVDPDAVSSGAPRKLRLLDRGRGVFGSYAKVLLLDGDPEVYAQFGPLSAYPRARQIRELYPRLPQSPLPAVITCVSSSSIARGQGLAGRLVEAVVADLAARGFSAIEAYPDLTLGPDEASAANPAFWEGCAFERAAPDERFPVMRRELT